jgi:hypothetical protein
MIAWLCGLCSIFSSTSAWAGATVAEKNVEQWGREEISLKSGHVYDNPFTEVRLQGRFTLNAKTVVVDGFYDGAQTWRIRFMPDQQGPWQVTTISNDPELNNRSASFTVGPPSKDNHGPVRVAKMFHFSYADGTPYFLLGTTSYNWLNRDDTLQNETLATLGKSPFTKLRFGLFPKWYVFNRVEPELYPYVQTVPLKFDLNRFNPEFFRHVEQRLADLERLGIQADIILFHPYDHLGFSTMDAQHDDAYIRYVAARMSSFRNIWWTMANEYDLFDPEMIPGQKTKDWDRMFQVLEESDPYSHLRGIHNIAKWYDHSKPWITHVVIQDGGGHPARRLANARIRYQKPTVVDEYGYEGNNGQGWGNLSGREEVIRHWEITMAGGYASHGETYVHSNGVLWWAAGGELVGESPARLGFLRSVMSAASYQDLSPSPEIAQGGTALAQKGQYYLLWVESPYTRSAQATEIELEGDGPYQVDLIDPWMMKIFKLGYVRGGRQAFATMMTPSLFRFTKVTGVDQDRIVDQTQSLLAKWIGDPTSAEAPKWVPIEVTPEHYSLQFTVGELLADPRTEVLLNQYFPNLPHKGIVRALTLEQISGYLGINADGGKMKELDQALSKVPVESR